VGDIRLSCHALSNTHHVCHADTISRLFAELPPSLAKLSSLEVLGVSNNNQLGNTAAEWISYIPPQLKTLSIGDIGLTGG
jgi:hypothetical protein